MAATSAAFMDELKECFVGYSEAHFRRRWGVSYHHIIRKPDLTGRSHRGKSACGLYVHEAGNYREQGTSDYLCNRCLKAMLPHVAYLHAYVHVRPAQEHVREGYPHYRATCTCGWTAETTWSDYRAANAAAREHIAQPVTV